jgi:GntR family transcriptional repressor for pyruvate dehydrogenase complex
MVRPNLSNQLVRQIMDLIRRERLQPGDRLPTVKHLAERFSVATPTLREALRHLQTTGVVEVRHGSGIYVRSAEERVVLANPSLGRPEASTILGVLEARLLIEPHLAGLAAQKADDARITELDESLREAERRLDDGVETLHRMNVRFHCAVAGSSGNPILAQTIQSLVDLYSPERLSVTSLYQDRLRHHQEHREILAAIKDRAPARAQALMRRHILGAKSIVELCVLRSRAEESGV